MQSHAWKDASDIPESLRGDGKKRWANPRECTGQLTCLHSGNNTDTLSNKVEGKNTP